MSEKNQNRTSPLPSAEDKARFVQEMFDSISPRYDLVNRVMTFKMDQSWRRFGVDSLNLQRGSKILDVACGTGDFVKILKKMNYEVVGIDFSIGMLSHANIDGLAQGDAMSMPFAEGSFDGLTCGFALRNFADLGIVFDEFSRVLRPGGRLCLVEVSRPTNGFIKFGHGLYFDRIVPRVGALLSSSEPYKYLPASTAYLPDEAKLRAMLLSSGFEGVNFKYFLGKSSQVITATRSAAL
ncbi:MAG: ubiquinone/menaquinone biosynthesis methyltransferase [Actinomycetota bacterium]|nr:ubiquinone/menaquinone biosynthesis methyltransferase [Actinomycetota bacterium]